MRERRSLKSKKVFPYLQRARPPLCWKEWGREEKYFCTHRRCIFLQKGEEDLLLRRVEDCYLIRGVY